MEVRDDIAINDNRRVRIRCILDLDASNSTVNDSREVDNVATDNNTTAISSRRVNFHRIVQLVVQDVKRTAFYVTSLN